MRRWLGGIRGRSKVCQHGLVLEVQERNLVQASQQIRTTRKLLDQECDYTHKSEVCTLLCYQTFLSLFFLSYKMELIINEVHFLGNS